MNKIRVFHNHSNYYYTRVHFKSSDVINSIKSCIGGNLLNILTLALTHLYVKIWFLRLKKLYKNDTNHF